MAAGFSAEKRGVRTTVRPRSVNRSHGSPMRPVSEHMYVMCNVLRRKFCASGQLDKFRNGYNGGENFQYVHTNICVYYIMLIDKYFANLFYRLFRLFVGAAYRFDNKIRHRITMLCFHCNIYHNKHSFCAKCMCTYSFVEKSKSLAAATK